MTEFDWQTDDEDSVSSRQLNSPVRTNKRRNVLILMTVALLSVGVATYCNLNRHAEVRAQEVRMDVLAAYRIWQLAATREDAGMLDSVLEGGDPNWTIIQRQLLKSDLLINREVIGLSAIRGSLMAPEKTPIIELDPDWQSAQVIFQQQYKDVDDQLSQNEIILEHTLSFEWTGSRWVTSDPGDNFWGEWETMGSEHVTLNYPQTEKSFASKVLIDLEDALTESCSRHLSIGQCPDQTLVNIRLEKDPNILFRLGEQSGPIFHEWTYLLPAPSLLGRPIDEKGYEIVFRGYADRIIDAFASGLSSPRLLPNQQINIICYGPEDPLPHLFQYDIYEDSWNQVGGDTSYRHIASNAEDSAVLLEEFFPGIDNHVRFELWQYGSHYPVFDNNVDPGWLVRLGWSGSSSNQRILIQTVSSNPRLSYYRLLDLARCSGNNCITQELEGLPLWSPTGLETIVQNGDQLYIGDPKGKLEKYVGRGFNPFWLEDGMIGFTRYENRNGVLLADLVQTNIELDGFSVLLSAEQIIEAFGEGNINPVYIEHVQTIPHNREGLLIYGRQYGEESSDYHIFLVHLDEGYSANKSPTVKDIQKLLTLNDAPAGYPSALSSTGSIPFVVSPDGRWLTVSWLEDKATNLWKIQLFDLESGETKIYTTSYPIFTFKRPFYDWSRDGAWLIISEDGFLRLIAPDHDYERIIGHGLVACAYPVWSSTATIY